jgi:mono/diheme cytochrome c family protein
LTHFRGNLRITVRLGFLGGIMRLIIIAMTGSMLFAAAAQAQNAPAGSAERGQKAYLHQMCHNCHGTVGQGGGVAGPKLAPNPWPWSAFAQQTRKPHSVMVPYSEKVLPEQDLADIYAYIVAIKPGPTAKDIPLLSGY